MKLIQIIKKNIIKIIKISISLSLASCVLSIFLLYYNYVGVQIKCENKSTDYHWLPNSIRSNMTEGFSWCKLDSNGYNNINALQQGNIDILLLGSSHSEAFNVDQNHSTIRLLNQYCYPFKCYSIAISGHELIHCINNLRNAYENYKPNKYIIIEIWKIIFDSLQLSNVMNNKHKPISLHTNNKYVYYLQKYVPSSRSVFKQVGLWFKNSVKIFNNNYDSFSKSNNNKDDYYFYLNNLLSFARKSVPNNIPIIIIYHPYYTLQSDGSIKNDIDYWYLDNFSKACKNNNIIFIDIDDDFQELYTKKHIPPYGFINTKVFYGHLNKYGHEVIAKRLAKEIKNLEERNHGFK